MEERNIHNLYRRREDITIFLIGIGILRPRLNAVYFRAFTRNKKQRPTPKTKNPTHYGIERKREDVTLMYMYNKLYGMVYGIH